MSPSATRHKQARFVGCGIRRIGGLHTTRTQVLGQSSITPDALAIAAFAALKDTRWGGRSDTPFCPLVYTLSSPFTLCCARTSPLLLPVPSSTPPPCSCSKCVVSGTSTGTVHDDGCSRHLQCVVTGVYGALSLSLLQVPRAGNPRRGRGLHDRPRRRNAAPTRAVSGRTPALRDLGTGEGGRGKG